MNIFEKFSVLAIRRLPNRVDPNTGELKPAFNVVIKELDPEYEGGFKANTYFKSCSDLSAYDWIKPGVPCIIEKAATAKGGEYLKEIYDI